MVVRAGQRVGFVEAKAHETSPTKHRPVASSPGMWSAVSVDALGMVPNEIAMLREYGIRVPVGRLTGSPASGTAALRGNIGSFRCRSAAREHQRSVNNVIRTPIKNGPFPTTQEALAKVTDPKELRQYFVTYLFTGWDRSKNVAGIEYAQALGDLAASSCERNHRRFSLRTEGIEESRFPCIRRSG